MQSTFNLKMLKIIIMEAHSKMSQIVCPYKLRYF